MPYIPLKEHLHLLGFSSPEDEKNKYHVWTNQANTRQIRALQSSGSIWLDFFERPAATAPWRKRPADPAPNTYADFHQELVTLGWVETS